MSICARSHVAFIFQKVIPSEASPAHPHGEHSLFELDAFDIHCTCLAINHALSVNSNCCLALCLIASSVALLVQ